MKRCRKMSKTVLILFLVLSIVIVNTSLVSAAGKTINVKLNPVTVSINGKNVKIDSFEFSSKYYIQMQDICSYLGIEYSYAAKTKTVAVFDRKPAKSVSPAKALYSAFKPLTPKALAVKESPLVIKINNKAVKMQHYLIGTSIYFAANELALNLNRDYALDVNAKTIKISDKKPSLPIFKLDTTAVTDKDVIVTIENWGNAVKKEYKIDEGAWQPYTKPVAVPYNGFVYARGTNVVNIQSDTAKVEIKNIRRVMDKERVSKLNKWAVKILTYDINGDEIGSGSGFILSSDGKIATNFHVIDMVPIIKVQTYDDKIYEVVGITAYDNSKDIAVLKINAQNLPVAVLGDSDTAVLGQDILTFGYPKGKALSVTFGSISSVSADPERYRNSSSDIQLSAPISPGNSGGPLLNMYGEVIGVNYAVELDAQNMNYAIPINELKPFISSNSLRSPSTIIKELYPVMNEFALEYYLYCNYPSMEIGDYKFDFHNIYFSKSEKYPNDLYVELYLNAYEYSEVLMAEFEGNKASVEKWAADIYQKVKERFPEKDVYVAVCFVSSFHIVPTGYSNDEVEYNNSSGLYDVFKFKYVYSYQYGQPVNNWR